MPKRTHLKGRMGINLSFLPQLKKLLRGKVVFLCVGNPLKGDDAAGCFFAQEAENFINQERRKNIYILKTDLSPENYLEKIVKIKPDCVFIVDAADFGGRAGEIKVFTEFTPTVFLSTHSLPLTFIFDYLRNSLSSQIFFIAIQPQKISWQITLTPPVKKAVKNLIREIFL